MLPSQTIVINNGVCRASFPECEAQFTLTVPDCSPGISPIQARTFSMRPRAPMTMQFVVRAETELDAPGMSRYCHGAYLSRYCGWE